MAVAAAEAQVTQAQIKLAALQQGRPEDVRGAQAGVDSANAKLSLLLKGATEPQAIYELRITVTDD